MAFPPKIRKDDALAPQKMEQKMMQSYFQNFEMKTVVDCCQRDVGPSIEAIKTKMTITNESAVHLYQDERKDFLPLYRATRLPDTAIPETEALIFRLIYKGTKAKATE
jgi:hypothetical protein